MWTVDIILCDFLFKGTMWTVDIILSDFPFKGTMDCGHYFM